MNTRRLLQSTVFALLLGGGSVSAMAGPSLFECLDGLAREAPEFSNADRQWLCGASANSPVPGYGERPEYVSCLLDTMAYRSMRGRGDLVTQACANRPYDRSADTRNLPTRLYCLEATGAANPGFGEADLRWLCGLSSNTLAPGYGDRPTYVACLTDTLLRYPSMAAQGDLLVRQCMQDSDRGGPSLPPIYTPPVYTPPVYTPPPPVRVPPIRVPPRRTPPPVRTLPPPPPPVVHNCPDPATIYDTRLGRCVSRVASPRR